MQLETDTAAEEPDELTEADHVAALMQHGWAEKGVLLPPESTAAYEGPPKTAAARRQASKRTRDRDRGWRQLNVCTVDDPDVRILVAVIAKCVADPQIRAAVTAAIYNPGIVATVDRLDRIRGTAKGKLVMRYPLSES